MVAISLAALSLLGSPSDSTAQVRALQDRTRAVVFLFSFRSTAPAVTLLETGFRQAIEDGYGSPVDLHVEHLDLPEAVDAPYGDRLAELLKDKYASRPIDLVVTDGGEALAFLLRRRSTLFPGLPIVFVGMTRQNLEQLSLPPDATGVELSIERQRTPEVALTLHPGTERVYLMGGSSASDRRAVALAQRLVAATAPKVEVVSLSGLPLAEQLSRLAALPPHSVVIFTSYRADSLGRSMVGFDVLRLAARASSAPTYGAADTWFGHGIVGGDLIQYAEMARRGGAIAARVLKGEPAATIPRDTRPASALMFDWRELQRWKIDEARLPAGSVVAFRETTVWEEHWGTILGALALLLGQGLLIGALLFERRTRHGAQADLVAAERRYRTVADFTSDWEYWTAPDGSFVYNSPSCAAITGYDAGDFVRRPSLMREIIAEEDRARWDAHREEALGVTGQCRLELRLRTATGETRWIDHVCSRVLADDGTNLGVRGSNRDITERKKATADLQQAFDEIRQLRDRLEVDNSYLREQLHPAELAQGIVGTSDVMQYVLSKARQVAPTGSTVLLLGETGVGKSLIAQAIHDMSPRRARPLVTLNCATLPSALVESELFGHEKGAFTGAHALRRGRFETANGSTLLLDEIGDLPLELQGKLLRAIQDGKFERVGGNVTLHTDVRLIAATNRKLDDDVRTGRFRQDLWYRLSVFPITVPPLRQRPEDIPQLVRVFVEKHCRKMGKAMLQVSKAAIQALQSRSWPGNVRELENAVERAVISATGSMFEFVDDVPALVAEARSASSGNGDDRRTLTQVERDHIVATLERLNWQVDGAGGAAEALAINASTLRSRMRKLGIQRPGRGSDSRRHTVG